MKKKIISTAISLAFSAALLSGIDSLHQFAYYVLLVMSVIAWLTLFCGTVKGDVAAEIRRHTWISAISTAVSLYALIFTGHPILAASSFMVSFFIVVLAFKKPEVAV